MIFDNLLSEVNPHSADLQFVELYLGLWFDMSWIYGVMIWDLRGLLL